ncbi:MAG: protoporphyrinogen oxidase [Cellulomonadaceae bacterium]|jgi:oxygen-dependent protoporphyrinogen oxidase|nr:protoporphyrinogen oxidase [Cellulomonadaceae bacterium]
MKLLIVGGGLTGLSAAYEALQHGMDVTVLEASDRLGGKVWTERRDGLVMEHGSDSVVAYQPEALALATELGYQDSIETVASARQVYLRAGGKLRPLPASMGVVLPARMMPFVTTRILSWPDKIRAGLDVVLPRVLTDGQDASIGGFLAKRLGPAMVRKFADPLVGGIYGASVDDLSIDAVLPSLRANERDYRSLLVAARATRPRGKIKGTSPFRSLAGGMGTLIDALESAVRAGGGTIHLGTAAEPGVLDSGEFDHVILTGGAGSSRALLTHASPAAAGALGEIPQTTSTVVTYVFNEDQFPQDTQGRAAAAHGWLESQAAPVSGVTVASSKWPNRAPEGTVLLRAFVPARLGPLAEAPDDELMGKVTAHLREVMGVQGEPSFTRIVRWSKVMPSYTVGHLDRVAAVEDALAGTRFTVAGAALHGVGLPACVASGRAAVKELVTA